MRVGAIDIGTNSIHLLVADVDAEGRISLVEAGRDQAELGSGGLDAERLAEDAFARGVRALDRFHEACQSLGVEDVHCAATSAVREASNGAAFCEAVKQRTGIHVRVISGSEEARLIYLGARRDLDFSRGRVLLFDVGGGSTEFILCDAEAALVTHSARLGHIRLADAFHRGELMSGGDRTRLVAEVRARLAPLLTRVHGDDFGNLVGTSGTVRALARIATLARGEALPGHEHGLMLHREELDGLVDRLTRGTRAQIAQIPGMDARRERTLPSGALLVREIMDQLGKRSLVTSARSLRDGLIVDWILRHRPELALAGRVPDPRRRSVEAMMDRYGVDRPHAELVTRFALELFDVTAPAHRLRVDDRRLLEFAALLHDVGHHIAGRDHHRHGQYLIRHTHMPGFTAPEIALIGNLVRFHRGGRPKTTHEEYAALSRFDRRRVRWLAGLLRVADALDRGHQQNVARMEARLTEQGLVVDAWTREAPDLERWSAVQRSALLAEVLEREVTLRLMPLPPDGDGLEQGSSLRAADPGAAIG